MTSSGNSPDLKLAIVLLAAGEGSRMGSIPKALLKKDGSTLLERFCSMVKSIHPIECLVVTGFHSLEIQAELDRIAKGAKTIFSIKHNPHAQNGQGSSVRLALESLHSEFDVLAVCLSDQPIVGEQELKALLEQFSLREHSEEMVMPQVDGQRGNPVLFSKKAVETILSTPGMVCRSYMDQHPEKIRIFNTNNLAYILDVDTEADIQRLGITRV